MGTPSEGASTPSEGVEARPLSSATQTSSLSPPGGSATRLRAAGVTDEETREIQEWIKINYKVRVDLDHYLAPFTDDQITDIVKTWRAQRPAPKPDRPPWCGQCSDDKTRRVDLDDGRVSRCGTCNPRHGQELARPSQLG